VLAVDLQTEQGDHVAFTQIPPYLTPPKVIIWGLRVFAFVFEPKPWGPMVYREVFTHWATDTAGDIEREQP
jgi:hypothetical protein